MPRHGVFTEVVELVSAMMTNPLVQLAAIGVLLIWVTALTVMIVKCRRPPWRDDGRPVFKRLRNGRIQFSWGVLQGLSRAQSTYHNQANRSSAESREDQGPPVAALLAREGDARRSEDRHTEPIPPATKRISVQVPGR